MKTSRSAMILAILLISSNGCTTLRLMMYRPPRLDSCPGPLVPTQEMEGSFVLRQRIRVRGGEVDAGFDLIVQKNGGRLVVVGLTPLGGKAFTVEQEGTRLRVESFMGPALPVPPENILRDLHRLRFWQVPGKPFDTETVQAERAGMVIVEEWDGGRLVQRRFVDAQTRDDIAVVDVSAGAGEAPRAHIHHPTCGYQATIVTLSEEPLPRRELP